MIDEEHKSKPGPGAIPVSDVAMYSVNSIMTGSAEVLKGSLSLIKNIPADDKEKWRLEEQTVMVLKALDEMKADFGKRIGRVKRGWGDLVPKVVKEYYEKIGYRARETDVQVDQEFKIDIVALRNCEVQAIQVKKGGISAGEIVETTRKASKYVEEKYSSSKKRIVTIFASKFPNDFLEIRDELMVHGIELKYLLPNHIVEKLPRYKYIFYE